MGLFIIVLILVLAIIGLYFLFKTLQWVFKKKIRIIGLFIVSGSFLVGITVYQQFFIKMEFVQSKVYPNLYLIQHPIKDDVMLHNSIKEKVKELLARQINVNDTILNKQPFTLRFYAYNKGDWGESGTVYFLEHEERPDGMTAELLEYYSEYELANFSFHPCKKNGVGYLAVLNYYKNYQRIKTDTLLHSCAKALIK